MADVFISYKSERRNAAEHLAEILTDYGYSVWWDYGLISGSDFGPQIEKQLRDAKAVVVLWCARAKTSQWVRSEATLAKRIGTFIPTRIEDIELPLDFMLDQTIDLSRWDGAPQSAALQPLFGELSQRVRPASVNLEGLARTERAWRRFGAPALEQFALIDPVETRVRERTFAGAVEEVLTVQTATTPSALAFAQIADSLHPADYEDFITHFPGTPEVLLASRCRRQLAEWAQLDRSDPHALSAFLESGPFRALAAKVVEAKNAAAKAQQEAIEKAQAERRTCAAAEAEAQCKKEERLAAETAARREREELDRRLGPAATRARQAAVSGAPVSERVIQLDVPGVADWPTPECIAIPPGRFLMGSRSTEECWGGYDGREEPQHEVQIGYPFAMGKHTVTFAEWDAAVAAGAKVTKPDDKGCGRGERPVINVSWKDVQAYLDWLNDKAGLAGELDAWRLPSEAEWEYACRAGTTTPFSFGETISTEQANYDGNYTYGAGKKGRYMEKTAPVGDYTPNALGLYQMHGNVWEWCADTWHNTYNSAPADGSVWEEGGESSRRVLRGGSWYSEPSRLRSADRLRNTADLRDINVGFRLARTL